MAIKAPRICGCGRIVPGGQRCQCEERRAAERKARFDKKRPNASARGYDRKWEREAKAFLTLPGNDLCRCGAPATVVMHVISIRARPDLRMDRTNWRPGCQRCNALDAVKERQTLKGKQT